MGWQPLPVRKQRDEQTKPMTKDKNTLITHTACVFVCIPNTLMSQILDEDEQLARKARIEGVSYWSKQAVAVICGVNSGVAPLLGSTAFTMFIACRLGYLAVNIMLGFSHKMEITEVVPLVTEGGITAASTFVLVWTLAYTLAQH